MLVLKIVLVVLTFGVGFGAFPAYLDFTPLGAFVRRLFSTMRARRTGPAEPIVGLAACVGAGALVAQLLQSSSASGILLAALIVILISSLAGAALTPAPARLHLSRATWSWQPKLMATATGLLLVGSTVALEGIAAYPSPVSARSTNGPLLAVVSPALEGPCLVTTQFPRGSNVIFRIQVINPTTGRDLTSRQLRAVDVVLPTGAVLSATFSTHEGGKTPFWVAHWTIPSSYPTGQVAYKVRAEGTSRAIEQVHFDVTDPEAYLTVTVPGSASGA